MRDEGVLSFFIEPGPARGLVVILVNPGAAGPTQGPVQTPVLHRFAHVDVAWIPHVTSGLGRATGAGSDP
jgi:hypothetical protein